MVKGKYYIRHSITGNYQCTVCVERVEVDKCIVKVVSIGKYTGLHVGERDVVYKSSWHKYILAEKLLTKIKS